MRSVETILASVYTSLKEKGYRPVSQITGYILTGDPTYITNHNNARTLISQLDRYDILRVLLADYLEME